MRWRGEDLSIARSMARAFPPPDFSLRGGGKTHGRIVRHDIPFDIASKLLAAMRCHSRSFPARYLRDYESLRIKFHVDEKRRDRNTFSGRAFIRATRVNK